MGSVRTMVCQCGFLAFIYLAVVALAVAAKAGPCVPWLIASGGLSLAFFVAVSLHRHREVLSMASEIDQILHGGRNVQFANCREGDLAILRNELGKMVDRLARTSATLEAERNSLADALADISHQIRTPLTAVGLMVANLETVDDPRERKQGVRNLEEVLDRISWLVATLLKMAKVDAGALKVAHRPTSVGAVVDQALRPLAMALDLRGIAVEVDVDPQAEFQGDERWCSEALENVVKNCMEHTPAGGTIAIVGRSDALATRITVTDTGPGIAAADLPRIFERFYRAEEAADAKRPSGSGATEGFGIGLSLARSLIVAQGGQIHASNAAMPASVASDAQRADAMDGASGSGARFDIVFPSLVV